MRHRQIWVGYDAAEKEACKVAVQSIIEKYEGPSLPLIRHLDMFELRDGGFYKRPHEIRDGRLWDVVSGAPMSTTHANARFFIPRLQRRGLALFMDGDVLVRGSVEELFQLADPRYALQCVKHPDYDPGAEKKDGHVQTAYARKNWSSVMLWNLDHPAHERLTDALLNGAPGRDLHRFCWLRDEEIGPLPPAWNWLAPRVEPKLVHYTSGLPSLPGYERAPYSDEWRAHLERTGAAGLERK